MTVNQRRSVWGYGLGVIAPTPGTAKDVLWRKQVAGLYYGPSAPPPDDAAKATGVGTFRLGAAGCATASGSSSSSSNKRRSVSGYGLAVIAPTPGTAKDVLWRKQVASLYYGPSAPPPDDAAGAGSVALRGPGNAEGLVKARGDGES